MMDINKEIPKKLGKFEIVRHLGKGSMATVFLGYDPFMDRNVAIKVALPEYFQDKQSAPKFKQMFFNEARIAGMLDNRFILPVYDAGMEDDLLYIVMEYISGEGTLKKFCRPETLLPVQKVLEIAYKCCRALDYAHTRDVVHRDIKPTNILMTDDMDVRIADFGIAQIKSAGDQSAEKGLYGSPRYMSPEQVSEEQVTHQSDLFSLGVVLFELLTGQLPFNAKTFDGLKAQILNDQPPLLKTLRPEVPDYLEHVIKRAMSKNPTARYQRGIDFASDLVMAFKHQKHALVAMDSTNHEKFKRLRANPFFKDFLDSELKEVLEASEWGEFEPGETIVREGEIDDSFFIIIKGKVDVLKGERILSTLGEGDCFGEMAYFAKTKRTASIIAVDEVMLLQVTSTLMEAASMGCQLKFMKVFLYTLIERLSKTSARLSKPEE